MFSVDEDEWFRRAFALGMDVTTGVELDLPPEPVAWSHRFEKAAEPALRQAVLACVWYLQFSPTPARKKWMEVVCSVPAGDLDYALAYLRKHDLVERDGHARGTTYRLKYGGR